MFNYSKLRKISGYNGLLDLAYKVFHAETSLEDVLALVENPQTNLRLSEADLRTADEVVDEAQAELPELAFALASLNLAAARRVIPNKLGRFTTRLGTLNWWENQLEQAIPLLEEGIEQCHAAGDVEGELIALGNLGNVYHASQNYEKAVTIYRQLVNLARAASNPIIEGMTHLALGNTERALGNLDMALEEYKSAHHLGREAAHPQLQIACIDKLSELHLERAGRSRLTRDYPGMIADLRQAALYTRSYGDESHEVHLFLDQSMKYMQEGDSQAALACIEAGLPLVQAISFPEMHAQYLINQAVILFSQGRKDEAIPCLEQAIELGEKSQSTFILGGAHGELGRQLRESEQPGAALDHLLPSIDLCQQAGYPHGLGMALFHAALAYQDLEQIEEAIPAASKAIRVLEQAGEPEPLAEMYRLQAELYYHRNQGSRAENLECVLLSFLAGLRLTPKDADPESWATFQHNLGKAYGDRIRGSAARNTERAIQAFERALQVFTPASHLESWANSQCGLAFKLIDRQAGDREQNIQHAIELCQAVLNACGAGGPLQARLQARIYLGKAHYTRRQGDRAENLELALEALQDAVAEAGSQVDTELSYLAHLHLGIAFYERVRDKHADNLEKALEHFLAALQARENRPHDESWALLHNNMGNVYRERAKGDKVHNLSQAASALQDALTIFTRRSNPRYWALAQNTLGSVYYELAQQGEAVDLQYVQSAIQCFENSLSERPSSHYPREHALTLGNLGGAYLLLPGDNPDDRQRGLSALHHSLELFERLGVAADIAHAAENLARTYFDRQDWPAALPVYRKCLDACETVLSQQATEEGRRAYLRQAAPMYGECAFCLAKLEQPPAALELLEAGRTRLLTEALNREEARLAQLSGQDRTAFTSLRQRIKNLEDSQANPDLQDWQALAAQLRAARQELQAMIERIREYAPTFLPTGLKAVEITSLLSEDQALLTWVVTSQGTAILLAHREVGIKVVICLDFTNDSLSRVLFESLDEHGRLQGGWLGGYDAFLVAAALGQASKEYFQDWFASIEPLWEALFLPILPELEAIEVRHLILAPYAGLHLLPLHAVGQPTLLERFCVSYIPSANTLASCLERAAEPSRSVGEALLVAHSGGNLPYAMPEVLSLAGLFDHDGIPVTVLAESQATRQAVESASAGKRWLHFACHGQYDWQLPVESGLWLEGTEGQLELYQLWQIQAGLDLETVRLVALSACETGLVDILDLPEEVTGLPAGFLLAGAPAVLSSLWTVNDLSSMLLMEHMLEKHFQGLPFPEALRQAQAWLRDVTAGELELRFRVALDKPDSTRTMSYEQASNAWRRFLIMPPGEKPFSHPFYWAAFNYTGV